jgi:hypothetical protein
MQSVIPIFQRSLRGILSVLCRKCSIDLANFIVIDATCSSEKQGAVVFRGSIFQSTHSIDIFCALSEWHRSGPRVLVNNRLHVVDRNCALRTTLGATECDNVSFNGDNEFSSENPVASKLNTDVITGSASAAVVAGFILILFIVFLVYSCRR